jgi:hypothetical protein
VCLPCVVARNWKNRTPQQCKSDDPAPTQQGNAGVSRYNPETDRTNCLKSNTRQGVGVIRGLRPHDSKLRHDVGPSQMTSTGCTLITRRKRDPLATYALSDTQQPNVEAFILFCNTHQPNTTAAANAPPTLARQSRLSSRNRFILAYLVPG